MPKRKGFAEEAQPSFGAEEQEPDGLMADLRLGPGGRIVIPSEMRAAMKLKEGDMLVAELVDGELRLMTIPEQVRRLQAITRKYVREDVSLVDEFLSERRAMWGEED